MAPGIGFPSSVHSYSLGFWARSTTENTLVSQGFKATSPVGENEIMHPLRIAAKKMRVIKYTDRFMIYLLRNYNLGINMPECFTLYASISVSQVSDKVALHDMHFSKKCIFYRSHGIKQFARNIGHRQPIVVYG
jgi:hypothetical protein